MLRKFPLRPRYKAPRDSSWQSSRPPASSAPASDGATPCTLRMLLGTVGAALSMRSSCLCCGVECVGLAWRCAFGAAAEAPVFRAPGICVSDGSVGRALLDSREQSVCHDGVGVDSAVAVPLLQGLPFCSAVGLACSRAGAPALWEATCFCAASLGPDWCPRM